MLEMLFKELPSQQFPLSAQEDVDMVKFLIHLKLVKGKMNNVKREWIFFLKCMYRALHGCIIIIPLQVKDRHKPRLLVTSFMQAIIKQWKVQAATGRPRSYESLGTEKKVT